MPIKKQRPGTHADQDVNRASDSRSESTAVLTSGNGHHETRQLLAALKSLRKGDFSIRLPVDDAVLGEELADVFNDVAELLEQSTQETAPVATVVGKEGRIGQRRGWVRRLGVGPIALTP